MRVMHVAREISEPCNPRATVSLIKIRGRKLITHAPPICSFRLRLEIRCIVHNLDFGRSTKICLEYKIDIIVHYF